MRVFDIVTLGSATLDIFVRSRNFEEVRDPAAPDGFDACFPLGAKIGVEDLFFATGGGAANAAVTFRRFGLKTACLTRVGMDAAGDTVIAQLKKERVATQLIQRDRSEKTSTSIILLAGTGHRAILTYRGASNRLATKEIPWHLLKTRWLYITSLGGNIPLLRAAFDFATRSEILIAWNPGNAELELGLKKLEPFLKQTAVFIVNREEASLLSGLPKRDMEKMLLHLSAYPRLALCMTAGQHGAYARANGETLFAPPLKAKRVNTTGAGDAFGSAYVAALARKLSPREALAAAMLNATSVITHMGAKAGILKRLPFSRELARVKIVCPSPNA